MGYNLKWSLGDDHFFLYKIQAEKKPKELSYSSDVIFDQLFNSLVIISICSKSPFPAEYYLLSSTEAFLHPRGSD